MSQKELASESRLNRRVANIGTQLSRLPFSTSKNPCSEDATCERKSPLRKTPDLDQMLDDLGKEPGPVGTVEPIRERKSRTLPGAKEERGGYVKGTTWRRKKKVEGCEHATKHE